MVNAAKRSKTAEAEILTGISDGFTGATAVKVQKLKSNCKDQPEVILKRKHRGEVMRPGSKYI